MASLWIVFGQACFEVGGRAGVVAPGVIMAFEDSGFPSS